jgi:glycerophosphoryl diester phosphodiesterase
MRHAWLLALAAGGLSMNTHALEIQGHRGARARYPENTIPAFEYALKVGVDTLEFDLGVSKDNVLIVAHDPHVLPEICITKSGKAPTPPPLIHSLTLTEIKNYDCGSLVHPKFSSQQRVPGTTMPTLDEVFEFVKTSKLPQAAKIEFNIETKSFVGHPEYTVPPAEFARLVLATVKKHGMLPRTVIQSFDHRTLNEARKLEPKVRIAALNQDKTVNQIELVKRLKADILSPNLELVTKAEVDALHKLGVRVIPWTANTPAEWRKLIETGVDGIITDDPQALMEFLPRTRP